MNLKPVNPNAQLSNGFAGVYPRLRALYVLGHEAALSGGEMGGIFITVAICSKRHLLHLSSYIL
jgi:hypothetical protein